MADDKNDGTPPDLKPAVDSSAKIAENLKNAADSTKGLKTNLDEAFSTMAQVGGTIKDKATSFADTTIDYVSRMTKSLFDENKFSNFINTVSGQMEGSIRDLSSLVVSPKVRLDIDAGRVRDSISMIAGAFVGLEGTLDMSKYMTFDGMGKVLAGAIQGIAPVELDMLKFESAGLKTFGEFAPASADVGALESSLESLSNVYRSAIEGSAKLGYSSQQSMESLERLASQSRLTMEDIGGLAFGMGALTKGVEEASDGISGFTKVQEIAAATGLDLMNIGGSLNLQIRSLGVSADQSLGVFGMFNKVQAATGLSINEISSNITDGASKFKFYGNNIEEVSVIYKQLLEGLGPGRSNLAGDILANMVAHVSTLNVEMKAFLGMTSSIGGGAGALESALRFDEAIASGEGLNEIMGDVFATIERISGAPMMTRKEAIETGRAQQYYVQEKLRADMLGPTGQQGELLVQAYRSGQTITREDIMPNMKTLPDNISQEADRRLDRTEGVLTRRLRGAQSLTELEGTEDISTRLLEIAPAIKTAGDVVNNAILGLGAAIERTTEAIFLSSSVDEMRQKGKEVRGREIGNINAKREAADFQQNYESAMLAITSGATSRKDAENLVSRLGVAQLMDVGVRDTGPIGIAEAKGLDLMSASRLSAPELGNLELLKAAGISATEAFKFQIGNVPQFNMSTTGGDYEGMNRTAERLRTQAPSPSVEGSTNTVLSGSVKNKAQEDSEAANAASKKEDRRKIVLDIEARIQDGGNLKLVPGKIFNSAETE